VVCSSDRLCFEDRDVLVLPVVAVTVVLAAAAPPEESAAEATEVAFKVPEVEKHSMSLQVDKLLLKRVRTSVEKGFA